MAQERRRRVPGAPSAARKKLDVGFLLDDDGVGDFLDEFDPDAADKEEPTQDSEGSSSSTASLEPPQNQVTEEEVVPEEEDQEEEEAEEEPSVSTPPAPRAGRKKPGPKPSAKKPAVKKPRPPRTDIGFPADLEEAVEKLRIDVVTRSGEGAVNRTDIFAASAKAVARTVGQINLTRVRGRGPHGSPSARAFDAGLEEAFYKAVGLHFVQNFAHELPDHVLQACYELYQQRMGIDGEMAEGSE